MEIYRVVITGPESTGKTSLAKKLAFHFKSVWIPEYAREYILSLDRDYNYDDVEHIAREQVQREKDFSRSADRFLFFDTHLIITKVWFKVVYQKYPAWIDQAIMNSGINLFLVCDTDIPWIPDPVRENGGELRERLLEMYINEIKSYGIPWKLVSGNEDQRTSSAINILKTFFKLDQSGIG